MRQHAYARSWSQGTVVLQDFTRAGARHQPGLSQELKQEPEGEPSSRVHHHRVSIQPNGEVRAAGVKGAIVLPPEGGRHSSWQRYGTRHMKLHGKDQWGAMRRSVVAWLLQRGQTA